MVVFLLLILRVGGILRWRRIVICEIAGVRWTLDLGDDWAFQLPVVESIPIYGLEEWMGLHKCCTIQIPLLNIAKALMGIQGAKTAND